MIIFKTLKYKNLLSTGDQEIEIDLSSSKSTLIVGHNGAGKSTMLDALSFVLFGKPHRPVNKPQLVNSVNGKRCRVEIDFEIGPKKYKIIRGLKPNIFEIWADGELINQDSHARDYQKHLESNILKLNHKSFHQVVVLGSGNFIPFMQMPCHTRRAVIEELLDIGIFSKMNGLLKIEQAELKDKIAKTVNELEVLESKIAMQTSHIHQLEDISKQSTAAIEAEAAKVQGEIDVLVEKNDSLLTALEEISDLKDKFKKLSSKRVQLEKIQHSMGDRLKECSKELSFYQNEELCPTCSQVIAVSRREEKLHVCSTKYNELITGNNQLVETIADTTKEESAIYEKLQRLGKLNNEFTNNATTIKALETQKKSIEMKKAEVNAGDLKRANEELEQLYDQRYKTVDRKANQMEERHYNNSIAELLKDTGIKTKIIGQYLPVMNNLINKYLKILDFFVLFELDENFNETIKSRHRDDFSYSSFSEGEKDRINLALLFAWRQVGKIKNSCDTNILFLDESFDGSLDGDGADNLLKILDTLTDTNVFVISHKAEILDGKFPTKLTFTRPNNFTIMKTETEKLNATR